VVEVRSLKADDEAPKGDAWVLVEKRGDLYFITGRKNGNAVDASVEPAGFGDPATAIRAATTWADLLVAPILYVKDA